MDDITRYLIGRQIAEWIAEGAPEPWRQPWRQRLEALRMVLAPPEVGVPRVDPAAAMVKDPVAIAHDSLEELRVIARDLRFLRLQAEAQYDRLKRDGLGPGSGRVGPAEDVSAMRRAADAERSPWGSNRKPRPKKP